MFPVETEAILVVDGSVQRVLELLGVFVFAMSGALLAVRKGFDIVGILVLAWITALGGGVMRDVVLGATPPTSFLDAWAFSLPAAAALITFFGHRVVERSMRAVLLFDAAGLALFTVIGTVKGAAFGLGIAQMTAVGVITGVGGGVLRDIVAREVPIVVRADSELYALPALAGSIALAFAISRLGYQPWLGVVGALFIFGVRLTALALGWKAPRARESDAAGHH